MAESFLSTRFWRALFTVCAFLFLGTAVSVGQDQSAGNMLEVPTNIADSAGDQLSSAATKVDVRPGVRDDEILDRLQSVFMATGRFQGADVRVTDGVVFLAGSVENDELKNWATDLAQNTQDVVAVLNRMEVVDPSIWDFGPAWGGLVTLWRDVVRSIPFIAFGLLVLMVAAGVGVVTTRVSKSFLHTRIRASLLRNVISRAAGAIAFLVGVYVVLRISGLTQLALTIVGGTGLIGLAVGIAFRDITENFLASIFLSMQSPFATGDLVEVDGVLGYVQQLNVRTTILMTLNGNIVQIPNANVYKTNICNFTTNANRREVFDIGIGYDDSIANAQEIALRVMQGHPAVLNSPEPSVLVESLQASTVNLRVYFWLNGTEHSWLKVRSAVIRLVKIAFQKHNISMPDDAREVVFPQGLPVTLRRVDRAEDETFRGSDGLTENKKNDQEEVSTNAEGGLSSEAGVIKAQARQAQPLNDDENLLSGHNASNNDPLVT
jgi:small-conductance mechanosensitive channel